MKKKFNAEGRCFPKKHFMVDLSAKTDAIFPMIEDGAYFTINRPHQYGKSALLSSLSRLLSEKEEYLPISISFEGLSGRSFQEEENFIEDFLSRLEDAFSMGKRMDLVKKIEEGKKNIIRLSHLGRFLTKFLAAIDQKTILMIDEVDRSSNNQLFLEFLGLLRQKYLLQQGEEDITFHSVILVGVHVGGTPHVKSLKGKILSDGRHSATGENKLPALYNSPWNIAAKFKTDLSLAEGEIETMLGEYAKVKKIDMDISEIAKKVHYYTSGHPFLTSNLFKIIDEELIKDTQKWTLELIEKATQQLLKESNTNFETLIKNLENHENLYQIVYDMLLSGISKTFNLANPDINFGIMHGVFRRNNGSVKIHNRIYEQYIYNYLSSKLETSSEIDDSNYQDNFLRKDGTLDFENVLLKFQELMKEQYSKQNREFLEKNGRLLFLTFLKPILNGKGFDFKEVNGAGLPGSEEKRLDVVVTFYNQKYIIELKRWRGPKYHQEGLKQLADYLDRFNLSQGYLLIFDLRTEGNREWKIERSTCNGKEILAVWV